MEAEWTAPGQKLLSFAPLIPVSLLVLILFLLFPTAQASSDQSHTGPGMNGSRVNMGVVTIRNRSDSTGHVADHFLVIETWIEKTTRGQS